MSPLADGGVRAEPVVSLARGLQILQLLAAAGIDGLRLTDVATELGVNKAIAHRLLGALVDQRYAWKNHVTDRYRLTFKLPGLGLKFLDGCGFQEWAQPALDRLAAQTQELVRLAVTEGTSLRWIGKSQGANSRLILDPAAGASVVLHATASGKAWLSALTEQEVDALVTAFGLQPQNPRTITDIKTLKEQISEAARVGYAITLEEMDEGINAVAAPITLTADGASSVVGTLSVAGPSSRLRIERLHQMGPLVAQVARELASEWPVFLYLTGGVARA